MLSSISSENQRDRKGRVVAGSNPVTPTGENEGVKRLA